MKCINDNRSVFFDISKSKIIVCMHLFEFPLSSFWFYYCVMFAGKATNFFTCDVDSKNFCERTLHACTLKKYIFPVSSNTT